VITVRHLAGPADLDACVRMQRETWGDDFSEVTPRSMILVAQKVGGIAAGAFEDGRMLGFVFGLTGIRDGELVHWSDMLAVDPAARDRGIGRQLKAFQREAVLALGVRSMYWTYDPLVARNAHLNLNVLGAEVAEYVPDMYGASNSPLHAGLGTDRFVVRWRLDGTSPPPGTALARIAIPTAIDDVQARSAEEAADWRARTRDAFVGALAKGHRVIGFHRDSAAAYYVIGE
jgi:predicted GNAT superfamily acetyltransferase